MNFFENLQYTYRQGSAVTRLIFINIGVFILLHLSLLILKLFMIDGQAILRALTLPSNLYSLMLKPWTLISYMFLHQEFSHILVNMLALFWFGKIALDHFTEKQLYGLYFFGGLVGGILFITAYNIFPYFKFEVDYATLLGASGAVIAIITATAVQSPNREMRLLLLGSIKLKYIAIVVVLISIFSLTSSNAGGEFAHLGGALYGYLFVVSLRRGKDPTKGFSRLMDKVVNLFTKTKKSDYQPKSSQKMSDAEYNMSKANKMKEVDRILDKIKKSGYGSLTEEEKKNLFN